MAAASDTVVVILAAGKGTRMRSELAKVLHRAGGRTLLEHVMRACQPLKPMQLMVVVGHQAKEVRRGRDRARRAARRCNSRNAAPATLCRWRGGRFERARSWRIVVPGDAPLLRTETLAALLDTHRRGEAAATILSAELDDPTDYGRMLRDTEGRVSSHRRRESATPEQRAIREVNSSIYCFTLEKLWPCLNALRPDNFHHELYLTDAIGLLRQRNERVLAHIAPDAQRNPRAATRAAIWRTWTASFALAKLRS